jgi:hypothetical protein
MDAAAVAVLGTESFFPSSPAGVPRGGVEASPRSTEMSLRTIPARSGVPLETMAMRMMIAEIAREQATELASVTDDVRRTETTVLQKADGTFAVVRVRIGRVDCTVRWCRSRAELFDALSQDLGAGDFALIGWRLLGKVR